MKKWCMGLLLLICSSSCRRQVKYEAVKDNELTIETAELNENKGNELTLKIRVIPIKEIVEEMDERTKLSLRYKMDSCFYFKDGNQKVYADLCQPIANGIKGVYDYLLEFETGRQLNGGHSNLIYQDRYFNRKIYIIKPVF